MLSDIITSECNQTHTRAGELHKTHTRAGVIHTKFTKSPIVRGVIATARIASNVIHTHPSIEASVRAVGAFIDIISTVSPGVSSDAVTLVASCDVLARSIILTLVVLGRISCAFVDVISTCGTSVTCRSCTITYCFSTAVLAGPVMEAR